MQLPQIKTKLPGPKAAALVARDHHVTSPSYTRDYPLVVERGAGCGIEDVDGNWFLDFTSGIAVTNTGHCHPHVVKAIKNQAEKLLHICGSDFYYEPMIQLAERLAHFAPGTMKKRVFFSNSGTEAVEGALKLARLHTRRNRVIAFLGAFHGRTYGALSLTASKTVQRQGFSPMLPEIYHADYNDLDSIKKLFKHHVPPNEVAAIFVEPIQGEGGYVVPESDFLPGLRKLCDEHGILMVADEVQSGIGRTGKFFASEHWNVVPDIICSAKGLASGMPLGAIIAKESVMSWQPGNHGSTFGGNPVACAAALATLELVVEGGFMENAAQRGSELITALQDLAKEFPIIDEVRGVGLMVAAQFRDDQKTGLSASQLRGKLLEAAFQNGLLLLGCGERALRFTPPLCISAEEVKTGVDLFAKTLTQI